MKTRNKAGILRGYVRWCAILLSLYACSSFLITTSTMVLRGIQTIVFNGMKHIMFSPGQSIRDDDSVRARILDATADHRQLVSHIEQWLRTQNEETMAHFLEYMHGKRKSRFIHRVEWVVDWLLVLYKIVAPFAILSLFSGQDRVVDDLLRRRQQEHRYEEDSEEYNEEYSERVQQEGQCSHGQQNELLGTHADEDGQDIGDFEEADILHEHACGRIVDKDKGSTCHMNTMKYLLVNENRWNHHEGHVSTPTLGSEPVPKVRGI